MIIRQIYTTFVTTDHPSKTMKDQIDIFEKESECDYKGEHYSVRDNGAVMRHPKNGHRPRPLDNIWTFGKKNEKKGYPSPSNRSNCILRPSRKQHNGRRPQGHQQMQQQGREPTLAHKIRERLEQPHNQKADNPLLRQHLSIHQQPRPAQRRPFRTKHQMDAHSNQGRSSTMPKTSGRMGCRRYNASWQRHWRMDIQRTSPTNPGQRRKAP